MDQKNMLDKLKELNHPAQMKEMSERWGWCEFAGLKAGDFDLWCFLKEKLDPTVVDLLRNLLVYDPRRRMTLGDALTHPCFEEKEAIKHILFRRGGGLKAQIF